MYPKVNNTKFNSLQQRAIEVAKTFFIGEKHEKNESWVFLYCLVFILFSSGSITISSFILAIGVPVRPITLFVTLFFILGDALVKLILSVMKNKN